VHPGAERCTRRKNFPLPVIVAGPNRSQAIPYPPNSWRQVASDQFEGQAELNHVQVVVGAHCGQDSGRKKVGNAFPIGEGRHKTTIGARVQMDASPRRQLETVSEPPERHLSPDAACAGDGTVATSSLAGASAGSLHEAAHATASPKISVVIPVYNEEDNVVILHERLVAALEVADRGYEVIFVNDGSTDRTGANLQSIAAKDAKVKVVNFRRNFGQTAAMMAGIDYAAGDIVVGLDGDLQNDPADIPRLVAKLDEGYDVVSGWRRHRKDAALRRNFPSRIGNWLISKLSGVPLHDYGCTLKAYRRDVIKGVRLYGEMHRFIPIYASWQGGRVTEIPVNHFPRIHGQSKYGLERIVKVVLDLVVVKFLASYANKPIYVFGGFGLISIAIAFLAGVLAVYLKLFRGVSFISTPLPLLVALAFITGVMSVLMGLIAEIIMRTYYESQGKQVYLVRDTINIPGDS